MPSIRRRAPAIIFVCALFAGCDDGPVSPSEALGEVWRLVQMQEDSGLPVPIPEPARYTVRFEPNGHVAVRSDCNTCGGSYTLVDSTLTIPALACTRVACASTSLDSRYTTLLGQAHTLTLHDDDEMTIEGPAGTLRFRK